MKTLISSASFFPAIDSAYLDCVADNLALMLLHQGIRDVRTPFACQWHFAFDIEQAKNGLPELNRSSFAKILEEQTSCKVCQETLDVANCVETFSKLLIQNQPVLVFGDAYFIPWQPYFGHEHQEHSFIVDGVSKDKKFVHIVDAHENTTEWGKAQPIACELPATALPVILSQQSEHAQTLLVLERRGETPQIDVSSLLLQNAQQMAATHTRQQFETFARYYSEHIQDVNKAREFEIALWLIGRARTLHSLWLCTVAQQYPKLLPHDYPERFKQAVVIPWQRVREQSYIVFRRVMRGRLAPQACFSLIEQTIAPQETMLAEALFQHLQMKR